MTCGKCVVCGNWVWGNWDNSMQIENKKGWTYMVCEKDWNKDDEIKKGVEQCETE